MSEFRQLTPEDAPAVARRSRLAFGPPTVNPARAEEQDDVLRWRTRLEGGNVWGWSPKPRGDVVAHAVLTIVDHWFGGRLVPCQHVASVSVAPEHRGRGAARALMEAAIRHGAEQGAGLSLLFPATTRLYRGLGYEHAGSWPRYRLEARHATVFGAADTDVALRLAEGDDDWAAIKACQQQFAALYNGPEGRGEERWAQLREAEYAYVIDGTAAARATGERRWADGYVILDHRRERGDWQYTLAVRDWAALSAAGLRAIIGMVGSHGTIGKAATFPAPMPNPWALLVPEQDIELTSDFWWMARPLDPAAAVAARGFTPSVSAEITLTITDPLLGAARGPWRLGIEGGKGQLVPAEDSAVTLDVRAFGPLFTGFRSPWELAAAGLAAGPDDALSALAAAFAGPPPFLLDFF